MATTTESPTTTVVVPKVVIHLRATGDAPILKQQKFKDELEETFHGRTVQFVSAAFTFKDVRTVTKGIVLLFPSDPVTNMVAGTDKFASVIDFLRRQLHRDTLFVYVNSAFSPNPDELVIDLFNNFGIDGKLVVNYACSMAWG